MASINASTAGVGGIISTADNTGNLNIQSGGSTKIAVTSAGAAVTGALTINGVSAATGGFGLKNQVGAVFVNLTLSNNGVSNPTFTETYDPNTAFNPSTGVYTVPETGFYFITGAFKPNCSNSQSNGGTWAVTIKKNTSTTIWSFSVRTNSAGTYCEEGSMITPVTCVSLNANDTIIFEIANYSGTSLTWASPSNNIFIARIG